MYYTRIKIRQIAVVCTIVALVTAIVRLTIRCINTYFHDVNIICKSAVDGVTTLTYNENMRMARDFRVLCLTFMDDIVSLFSNI